MIDDLVPHADAADALEGNESESETAMIPK